MALSTCDERVFVERMVNYSISSQAPKARVYTVRTIALT